MRRPTVLRALALAAASLLLAVAASPLAGAAPSPARPRDAPVTCAPSTAEEAVQCVSEDPTCATLVAVFVATGHSELEGRCRSALEGGASGPVFVGCRATTTEVDGRRETTRECGAFAASGLGAGAAAPRVDGDPEPERGLAGAGVDGGIAFAGCRATDDGKGSCGLFVGDLGGVLAPVVDEATGKPRALAEPLQALVFESCEALGPEAVTVCGAGQAGAAKWWEVVGCVVAGAVVGVIFGTFFGPVWGVVLGIATTAYCLDDIGAI